MEDILEVADFVTVVNPGKYKLIKIIDESKVRTVSEHNKYIESIKEEK